MEGIEMNDVWQSVCDIQVADDVATSATTL